MAQRSLKPRSHFGEPLDFWQGAGARQPVASTALRPSGFADILIRRAGGQVFAGSWTGAAGEGRANFIDTRDIAMAARVALLADIHPESQRTFHLTGPRTWTMRQIAGELTNLLGHPVVYINRSPEEERAVLLAGGLTPFVADLAAKLPHGDPLMFLVSLRDCNLYTNDFVFVPQFTRCSVVLRDREHGRQMR
jgi:hypothetical protein